MAEICILTDDERLSRMLTLLCMEDGHTVGTDAPAVLITDRAELPPRLSILPRLFIGTDGLSRPFLHSQFKQALAALLAKDATPLLTPTEARLYEALRAVSPHPVSRADLIRTAFGEKGDEGMLNLYIHYLRKKLEKDGVRRIFVSRGKGYFYDASHTFR